MYKRQALYEVKCPTCSEVITVDESTIEEGSTICPKCGEELEFDMEMCIRDSAGGACAPPRGASERHLGSVGFRVPGAACFYRSLIHS